MDRIELQRIARRVMIEKGFEPDFPAAALAELAGIRAPAPSASGPVRDLRGLLWCSIDNDDSRDLDQLTVAEALPGGATRILVAIADVDALVRAPMALDAHARRNTTSVYTAAAVYPMLPEELSTDLTSLSFSADRLALVVDLAFGGDGSLQSSDFYRACVRNRAKLAYPSLAAWLEGEVPAPDAVRAVEGLEENLRLQDSVAGKLNQLRHGRGALAFQTLKPRALFDGAQLTGFDVESGNRAQVIIEDFMIASNTAIARFLASRKLPFIRRIVRTPRNWARIAEIAAEKGHPLPRSPDAMALSGFLKAARAADPLRFPDLSLCIIKLIGPGEYVLERPDGDNPGHFGLAVDDYTHSTAPNRRYPDLVLQRILKAALAGGPMPYADGDLDALAAHCTERADEARKVERQVVKSAAALFLQPRIGQEFDSLVTGAGDKGTWVRLMNPPVEGRLARGFERKKVGQRLRVRLVHTDAQKGHVDFVAVGN